MKAAKKTRGKVESWTRLRSGVRRHSSGNWFVGRYATGWYQWSAKGDTFGPFQTEIEAMREAGKPAKERK